MKQIIARLLGVAPEKILTSSMIISLIGFVIFTYIIVFWFKETFFSRERKLKEGEKYTYRKLPTDSYELDKILEKAREEKDYETEFIVVRKINKLRPKANLWTFNELFRFYYNGLGTKKNEKKALRYLMPAYKQDYAPARFSYGSYLQDKKRYQEAAGVFRAGYLKGLGNCAFALYKLMADGLIKEDREERFQALFVAKEQEIPEAIEIYDSYEEHKRFAPELYQYFAEKSGPEHWTALLNITLLHKKLEEGKLDELLIILGALCGVAGMQHEYALLLNKKEYPRKNEYLAFIFGRAAARQGDSYGISLTAINYMEGHGVSQNLHQAEYWAEKAVEIEHKDAHFLMCNLYRIRYQKFQDEDSMEAYRSWAEEGVKAGNTDCMWVLGRFEEVIDNDINEARRLYARGANLGNKTCKKSLDELNKKYKF